MGFLDILLGRKEKVTPNLDPPPKPSTAIPLGPSSNLDPAPKPSTTTRSPARVAKSNEHYVLSCRECGFNHHIPNDCFVNPAAFSVDVKHVRLQCVYGGAFTVTLGVEDFTVAPTPESGAVLRASIADNMKVLNRHILSHCDPVFVIIQQSSNRTNHDYKRQPAGSTYVKVSGTRGADVVGKIDASKAEIPGVSW